MLGTGLISCILLDCVESENVRGLEVLYCTVLYCTVLYCTVLYCTGGVPVLVARHRAGAQQQYCYDRGED